MDGRKESTSKLNRLPINFVNDLIKVSEMYVTRFKPFVFSLENFYRQLMQLRGSTGLFVV